MRKYDPGPSCSKCGTPLDPLKDHLRSPDGKPVCKDDYLESFSQEIASHPLPPEGKRDFMADSPDY